MGSLARFLDLVNVGGSQSVHALCGNSHGCIVQACHASCLHAFAIFERTPRPGIVQSSRIEVNLPWEW